MRSNVRSFVAMALAVAVLVYPTAVLAQENPGGTAAEGMVAGQMDGKANANGALWMGAGCLFGIWAVGAAYLIVPSPPATRLLGKSSEYVMTYTDAYKEGAKSEQTKNAWIGCVVGYLAGGLAYLIIIAAAAADAY
jgi:hypothetical protein